MPGLRAESQRRALLELGEELRNEGVAVGTSELLDAFAALREIPWTAQADFREALAATLAKSQEDRRIFELVFDRFFFRAVELAARAGGRPRGATTGGRIRPGELDLEELSEEELDALRRQIAAALRDGRGRDARPRAHGDRRARAARRARG